MSADGDQESNAKKLAMIAEAMVPRAGPVGGDGDAPAMPSATLEALKMAHQSGGDLTQVLERLAIAPASQPSVARPGERVVTATMETILDAADLIADTRRAAAKIEMLESAQKQLAEAISALDQRLRDLEGGRRDRTTNAPTDSQS
ncbi:hypothetical protein [Methylocapsa acidiphila]|uniref:hypothetical protein n=1 Tax=Methylocapsa acidiphila TaxID=133552 RepID=UPI00047D02F5|nr:hypothetical protein [Methylocapsa acidiphila]